MKTARIIFFVFAIIGAYYTYDFSRKELFSEKEYTGTVGFAILSGAAFISAAITYLKDNKKNSDE